MYDAIVWEHGVAVFTVNFQFYILMDFDSPFTIKLKDPSNILLY